MTDPRHAAFPTPDLGELRALCVAAELGTIGRAAVRLRVSQPSLSKRVQSLEARVGTRLLERSPQGVKLTPAGRRLYERARSLLESADEVGAVMAGIRVHEVVRLAASHSATEAFVAALLASGRHGRSVELVSANSQVVRDLVADGRADLGVAASRPNHTPYPGVRETVLVQDAIVCGVPESHRWARRKRIGLAEFLQTPLIVRDPSSNARWTVEAALAARGLTAVGPLVEAPTPRAALSESQVREAPVLLSRHVLAEAPGHVIVPVEDLEFPRAFVLLYPAYGEPPSEVRDVVRGIIEHVRIWLR